MGKVFDSLELYESVEKSELSDDDLRNIGLINLFVGDVEKALVVYKYLYEKHPENLVNVLNYGDVLNLKGSISEARFMYNKVVRSLSDDSFDSYINRAQAYAHLGFLINHLKSWMVLEGSQVTMRIWHIRRL